MSGNPLVARAFFYPKMLRSGMLFLETMHVLVEMLKFRAKALNMPAQTLFRGVKIRAIFAQHFESVNKFHKIRRTCFLPAIGAKRKPVVRIR